MTDERKAALLKALTYRIDDACNQAAIAGLSMSNIGFVLARVLGTCTVAAQGDDNRTPEEIADHVAASVREEILDVVRKARDK